GANAVVFAVLNAFILHPLDLPRVEGLYSAHRSDNGANQSYPDYVDYRDRNRSFERLAAYDIVQVAIDAGNSPTSQWMLLVSGNYFDALGLQPYLGRFFHAADEHGPDSAPYLVLSYDYWRIHFPHDRGVVGRVVRLNKHPYTILGVGPPGFHGTLLFFTPTCFAPLVQAPQI